MNDSELRRRIAQAVADALRGAQNVAAQAAPAEKPCPGGWGTVALVPGLVPFAREAADSLRERYKESVAAVTFGQCFSADGMVTFDAETVEKDGLLQMITDAERVVLLAPSLRMIQDLAEGRDESLPQYLFLHAALWGKKTAVLLDFPLPRGGRILSGSGLGEHIDSLRSIGVEWHCYREKQPSGAEATTDLLTESMVTQAFKEGQTQLVLRRGTMVTPLAKDAARELGMKLNAPEVC